MANGICFPTDFPRVFGMTQTNLSDPQQTILNNYSVASVRIITIARDSLHC